MNMIFFIFLGEEADESSDVDDPALAFKKQEPSAPDVSRFKKSADADDGSESDSDWGSESSSESSTSDEDDKPQHVGADYFRKDKGKEDDEQKVIKKERKERKDKDKKKKREEDDGEGEWETVKGGVAMPSEKPKMFAKDAEINTQAVLKKLNEIMTSRIKKRSDRREQIELLHELQSIAEQHSLGPAIAVKIKFCIVSSIFDYNPKVSDAMKPEYWSKLLKRITEMLETLLNCQDIVIAETVPDDDEEYEKPPYKVHGCVLTLVERLDEEFTKLLKECDPHSNEYVERWENDIFWVFGLVL